MFPDCLSFEHLPKMWVHELDDNFYKLHPSSYNEKVPKISTLPFFSTAILDSMYQNVTEMNKKYFKNESKWNKNLHGMKSYSVTVVVKSVTKWLMLLVIYCLMFSIFHYRLKVH